jgi:hypothetical protein
MPLQLPLAYPKPPVCDLCRREFDIPPRPIGSRRDLLCPRCNKLLSKSYPVRDSLKRFHACAWCGCESAFTTLMKTPWLITERTAAERASREQFPLNPKPAYTRCCWRHDPVPA